MGITLELSKTMLNHPVFCDGLHRNLMQSKDT